MGKPFKLAFMPLSKVNPMNEKNVLWPWLGQTDLPSTPESTTFKHSYLDPSPTYPNSLYRPHPMTPDLAHRLLTEGPTFF